MKPNILLTTILFLLTISELSAGSVDDFFRSTGKIYTVLAVVVILFVVLILFLVRLDKKVNKLEKRINQ